MLLSECLTGAIFAISPHRWLATPLRRGGSGALRARGHAPRYTPSTHTRRPRAGARRGDPQTRSAHILSVVPLLGLRGPRPCGGRRLG